jgi:GNAT superfamily N-acetyltransferase
MNPIIQSIRYTDTWPIRHQVMWPDEALDYVILSEDEKGLHYGLFIDDRLISVVSLFVDHNEAQFRKFATVSEQQGKGIGTALLTHLMKEVQSMGITRLWCNARTEKASFYQKFGFQKTNQEFSKKGQIYVMMEQYL